MKVRTAIRIAVVLVVLVGIPVWMFGHYDAVVIADKACLRARVGESSERAKEQLRSIVASRNAEVRESGDRTSAIFRWMGSDVAGCTFVSRDGKVVEVQIGRSALAAIR